MYRIDSGDKTHSRYTCRELEDRLEEHLKDKKKIGVRLERL